MTCASRSQLRAIILAMPEEPENQVDRPSAPSAADAAPLPETSKGGEWTVQDLLNKIAHLPKNCGVYLFKDARGTVLYVGKAKDLRSRVGSYFQDSADLLTTRGPEIARMAALVRDLDFLDCETEVDALLTES